jgi:hypothetical protein
MPFDFKQKYILCCAESNMGISGVGVYIPSIRFIGKSDGKKGEIEAGADVGRER